MPSAAMMVDEKNDDAPRPPRSPSLLAHLRWSLLLVALAALVGVVATRLFHWLGWFD